MTGALTWVTPACCSAKRAGQEGPITRLMSCTEEQLKDYKGMDLVPTFVAPSFKNMVPDDEYAAYNKPGAIMAWLQVPISANLTCYTLRLDAEGNPFSSDSHGMYDDGGHSFDLHRSLVLWQEQEPKEEYILIVDADNIMRFPFDPVELKVEPGAHPKHMNNCPVMHG